MATAQGFWSYVHKDNEGMHGAILRVAEHVQGEYGVITGGLELDLFLDNMKLKWGDKWRDRIREAIESSTFFIPIITPRYFKSEECRNELLGFAEQAVKLGREALIMPLYFVEVPELEAGDSDDPMIKLVADSQMEDWRNLRFLDQSTQPYRLALNDLATELREVSRERETTTTAKSTRSEDDDDEGGADSVGALDQQPQPESDEGLLEQLAEGEEAFPRLVTTLTGISSELEEIGGSAQEATKEIQESDAKGGGFKARLAVTRGLAKKLDGQADQLEQLASEYVADLVIVDPAVRKMIQLASDQGSPDETAEFFSSIMGMISSSDDAAKGINEMVESLDEASNMSRDLDAPLNRLRSSLQSMIDSNRRMEAWKSAIEGAQK